MLLFTIFYMFSDQIFFFIVENSHKKKYECFKRHGSFKQRRILEAGERAARSKLPQVVNEQIQRAGQK